MAQRGTMANHEKQRNMHTRTCTYAADEGLMATQVKVRSNRWSKLDKVQGTSQPVLPWLTPWRATNIHSQESNLKMKCER